MRKVLRAAAIVVALAPALRAEAFPAFAKKYGVSCSACHVAWPIFNPQGINFRDNGYQFGLGKDDPVTKSPDYLPFAIRTTAAYQFTRTTNQESDRGPITVTQGGVPLPGGMDLLTGGTIAKDLSFLVVAAGFNPEDGVALESAWFRFSNLLGSGWANLRLGKFELDQPASAHRGVSLTYGYAVYGAHPAGSMVGFDYGENQVGVELDGHDARSMTRYSLSLTSANASEGLSGNGWSSPMVYGHVQQAFELGNPVLPWARVGAFGGVGWWPTKFDTIGADPTAVPDPIPGEPIPGTGRDHKKFYRAGAELSWMLGYPATPAFFTAAWMYGRDEKGLLQGADPVSGADLSTRAGAFNGGFLELDWVPVVERSYLGTPWLVFARWDLVRFEHGGVGDTDGATLGVRRYLALGPRASAAIHVEGHYDRVKAVGASLSGGAPRAVETQAAMAGIDFDY